MGGLTTRQLKSRLLDRRTKQTRQNQLKPGDILQGRYEVIGVLGVGGFSSVYKARDLRFPNVTRLCAIKEMVNLASDAALRDIAVKSFEREASILATLEHPAIPDVYDFFTEADRSYLVLEFIRGKDLDTILAESPAPLEQETVLEWTLQICEVLGYLHGHKPHPVVFRDLKPSNLMLNIHDRIHIIDFNIAKVFQSDEKHTMMGTEGYSPPEQYRGESSPAGDIYALGATLHHLLTKQDPRMEVPFSFSERPINAVNPTVTPHFQTIIMRCLSYNAADRYPNSASLAEALRLIAKPRTSALSSATVLPVAIPTDMPAARALDLPKHSPLTPSTSAKTVQPLWSFKCEDEIRSTPLLAKNMVLVGAYDNNLYALTTDKGQFVWKFPANDGIAGTPTIYNESVFIGSADKYLYSIGIHNGRQNWKFAANGPIYSSPKALFEHVFFGSDDGYFYAVNVNTGRTAWKTATQSPIRSSPFVGETQIFVGTEGGVVFCFDLSGKIKWQFPAKRAVTSTPAFAEDMLFVGSMDNTLYAIDAHSGWSMWRFRANRPIISSPIVQNSSLYVGSADGNLYALDIYSGRKLWAYKTEGQISSSPAVWEDAVYFGSTDGYVYSLSLKKGELRWRFQTGGFVVSSPTVADGIVFIGSADHHLYALPA